MISITSCAGKLLPRGALPFPKFTPGNGLAIADPLSSVNADDPRLIAVKKPVSLCNPANKNGEAPDAPDRPGHLEAYQARLSLTNPRQPKFVKYKVAIENQLGVLALLLSTPDQLLVPTAKALGAGGVPDLVDSIPDHFRCYKAAVAKAKRGEPPVPTFKPVQVTVRNQLAGPLFLDLRKPTRLCAPANIAGEDPDAFGHAGHLVCYLAKIALTRPKQAKPPATFVSTHNRFGDEALNVKSIAELCIPSAVAGD